MKSQIIINQETHEIVCTAHGQGKEHDFCLFKRSKVTLAKKIKLLGDKGYQGIQKIHKQSITPCKKKPKQELSKEEKKINKELARQRIVIEHVNRHLKIFKVLSERYRNRRKRFGLRFNLIAGFYNYDLLLRRNS